MLVPEVQHQPAHLESAPPSCETAGSKLPASASDTPSYPRRGWGFPPLLFSSTLLSSSRGDAGLRQRRREAGRYRRPGGPPPPPRGAVGAVRARRAGPTGARAGFQKCSGGSGSGQGGGEPLSTGPRGAALEGAAHGRGEEGAGGWEPGLRGCQSRLPHLVRTAPSRAPHQQTPQSCRKSCEPALREPPSPAGSLWARGPAQAVPSCPVQRILSQERGAGVNG